ncbi:MAG: acyltransferase [Frankiales bacterium]|nr:acyltransferase [Frankiales bacterium]
MEYRPALDGVRCVAVYLVLLFHGGLAIASGGFIGVDLFFVLSGFLITNVLLTDIERYGRVRFGRFYSRRARRLLPAAVVTVVATSVVFLLIAGVVERLPLVRDAQSSLLYVANWHFLHAQNDYFASGVSKSPFLHFWSLGIEEQFYVVFPLLLMLLCRFGRGRRVTIAGLGLLFALSLLAQLHWAGADPNHAYYGTDARAYQLLAGALLAFALRGRRPRLTLRAASLASGAGLIAMLLLGSGLVAMSVSHRGVAATAAATLLLAGLTWSEAGWVGRWLSRPVPRYLGGISYSTYLWHWPVIVVLLKLTSLGALEVTAATAVLATGLAALSTACLEMPIRRAPRLDPINWRTVAAGVGACALVAALVVPPVLRSNQRPLITTAEDAARPAAATARLRLLRRHQHHLARSRSNRRARVPSLDWNAIAGSNGPGRTCGAQDPQRCVVVPGHGLSVLLVGDSHARMLAPVLISLAHKYGFTLSLNALSGCPWQADISNLHDPPAAQAACTAARGQWYRDVLPKLRPNIVILAEYARDNPAIYGHTLVRTGGSHESLHQLLQATTKQTLAQITATGARALIMNSILVSSFDPLVCLSRVKYVDQCDVPAPSHPPFSDQIYAEAARSIANVFTFDINRIVCPTEPICHPMIGPLPVWRNFNHYTPQVLIHYQDQIWATIKQSGALQGLSSS